jgi:deferrochelatase/peroxidase EfeB
VIILGAEGDPLATQRPTWAVDGSFLVFRKLKQMVPEFHNFIGENPVVEVTDRTLGSELRCAQFFGRWRSGVFQFPFSIRPQTDVFVGAPLVSSPGGDNEEMGNDPQRNNDFTFNHENHAICPYSAHIRNVNPRDQTGIKRTLEETSIVRAGIAYGEGMELLFLDRDYMQLNGHLLQRLTKKRSQKRQSKIEGLRSSATKAASTTDL